MPSKRSPLKADGAGRTQRGGKAKHNFTVVVTCGQCHHEQAVVMHGVTNKSLDEIETACDECGSADWMIRVPEEEE